jgi:hypothetical protein
LDSVTPFHHYAPTDLVAQVHVDRAQHGETTAAARKLKHRFTEEQLEKVMDDVEST